MTLVKSADPTTGDPGDTITYTITYQNTGDVDLTDVIVVDDYDETFVASISNISLPGPGLDNGDTITWNIGTLNPGDSGSVTYDATLEDADAFPTGTTEVDNIALITSTETDPEELQDDASVTITVSPPPSPQGGGTVYVEPTCWFDVDMLGEVTRIYVSCDDGRCIQDYEPEDPDDLHFLEFNQGTQVTYQRDDRYNPGPPRWIRMRVSDDPPAIGGNNVAVSEVYNFTGYTATGLPINSVYFDKTVGMQIDYDPDNLPDNATSVGIAAWDPEANEWVIQPQSTGRVAGVGTATADISHFSTFAVLATTGETVEEAPAPSPTPASQSEGPEFSSSNLVVSPMMQKLWGPVPFVLRTGHDATISATISNTGDAEGTYTAELKFDGTTVGTQEVTLGSGESKQVRFEVSNLKNGEYKITLGTLTGNLTSQSEVNWWLLGGLMAVIVGTAALIFARERKRRRLA
ncbi:MAG: CARDB domain-containing protein, partial [Chloroflexota bacterium]